MRQLPQCSGLSVNLRLEGSRIDGQGRLRMRGFDQRRDGLFSYVRPESRIPKDHPLRLIRSVTDEALKVLDAQFAAL